MNLKLLIAFLVLPFCGKAQTTLYGTDVADTSHKPPYFAYNGTLKINRYRTDTIKCIMLVCDTSHSYSIYFKMDSIQPENHLFFSGRDIKEDLGFANQLLYYQIGYVYYTDIVHVAYLDENKKPLSKSIIVWMSINTEQ